MAMRIISVTDIGDFKIGNAEDSEKGTGCTVVICEKGAVGGVDVRGGGPATRETDLLRSENTVNSVNAVVLSGGSAFGLEAASGVMRELSERKIGFDVGDDIVVPIVCGASLYDLPVGDPKAFPDVSMGIRAVENAYEGVFSNGNHGAGTGATVGKLKGYERAMKTGLGTFACGDGVVEVGAIAAVNAVGDIYNGAGNIVAGLRSKDGKSIYGTIKTLKGMVHDGIKPVEEKSTAFINKADISNIKEALAAAARQFEEEKAAAHEQAAEIPEEEIIDVPEAELPAEISQRRRKRHRSRSKNTLRSLWKKLLKSLRSLRLKKSSKRALRKQYRKNSLKKSLKHLLQKLSERQLRSRSKNTLRNLWKKFLKSLRSSKLKKSSRRALRKQYRKSCL